ncbi:MAG: hypothetical protein HQL30_06520 [Candidatus Omnitrophica bacterium]|nr:hypothetical protein [Candidatus Omnitrophota bacterium]
MLTKNDSRDMLKDSLDAEKRDNFRIAGREGIKLSTFDEYLHFLEKTQEVFGSFPVKPAPTPSSKNKL